MAVTVRNKTNSYEVYQFLGVLNSNSYLISDHLCNSYLIDCGIENPSILFKTLADQKLNLKAIFLTHEHFDHVFSLTKVLSKFKAPVFCSEKCGNNLSSAKENLSKFYFDNPIEFNLEYIYLYDEIPIIVNNNKFTPLFTPGHSPGSTSIKIDNKVFSGDTILNGVKSPLTFPHSNREQYLQSIEKLKSHITQGTTIYPGHGEPFVFNTIDDLLI